MLGLVTVAVLAMAADDFPGPIGTCDDPAGQAIVESLDNQAFAAMRAASQAVAQAARRGEVGTAGEAEWAQYQAYRAKADQRRIDNLRIQMRCVATSARASLAPPASPPPAPPPAPPGPAPSSYDPPSAGRRFALGLELGGADYGDWSWARLKQDIVRGRYEERIKASSGAAALATPIGSYGRFLGDTTYVSPVPATDMDLKAWSSREALSLEYAPYGQQATGVMFVGEASSESLKVKGHLSQPFKSNLVPTGSATLSQSCPGGGAPCTYFRSTLVRGGLLVAPDATLTELSSDDLEQSNNRVEVSLAAINRFDVERSIGTLRIGAGVGLAGGWWTYKEVESFNGVGGEGILSFTDFAGALALRNVLKGQGPSLRANLLFSVEGPAPLDLPIRWGLKGSVGVQWVDLDMKTNLAANNDGQLMQSRVTSEFAGDLDYAISEDWSARLGVAWRKAPFIATTYANHYPDPRDPVRGATVGPYQSVRLRSVPAMLYSASLKYHF